MINILAFFWDVDGTLIFSAEPMYRDCCQAAKKFGLRTPSFEEFLAVWARPWPELLNALWPGVDIEAFNEQFEEGPPKAIPGARKTLLRLGKQGCFQAVISNRERESLTVRMTQAGMPLDIFSYVQAVDDFAFAKPDSRVFNRALSLAAKKGISRSRVVYVGDTLSDLMAAQGAGIMFIAVLTGGATKEQFVTAGLGEVFILNSVKDLPDFLTEKKK